MSFQTSSRFERPNSPASRNISGNAYRTFLSDFERDLEEENVRLMVEFYGDDFLDLLEKVKRNRQESSLRV